MGLQGSNIIIFGFALVVLMMVIPPNRGQVTFSRSWVPQGKRSGIQTSPGEELTKQFQDNALGNFEEICKEVKNSALSKVAVLVSVSNFIPFSKNYEITVLFV